MPPKCIILQGSFGSSLIRTHRGHLCSRKRLWRSVGSFRNYPAERLQSTYTQGELKLHSITFLVFAIYIQFKKNNNNLN